MKKFNLFMTFFTMLMLVIGCSNPKSDIEVNFLNNNEIISTEGFHTYKVEIKNEDESGTAVEKVYLYLNMEMMNHPIEGTMEKAQTGIYSIDLPLAMSGDWYAVVTVTMNGQDHTFEDFQFEATGEKNLDFMKGYNADEQ